MKLIKGKFEYNRILMETKQWFKDNDYIELQAIRGTISRDSEKYQNYLKEYNEKLNRLRELEAEINGK